MKVRKQTISEERPLAVEIRHTSYLLKSYVSWKIDTVIAADLTGAECMIMGFIFKNDPLPTKTSSIIKEFKISKGTVSQTLASLEKKKYIIQHSSKDDRRAKEISLSKSGRLLKRQLDDVLKVITEQLERNYTPEDRKELVRLLDIIRNNIREDQAYGSKHDFSDCEED